MAETSLKGVCSFCGCRVELADAPLDPDDAAYLPDCELFLVSDHNQPGTSVACEGVGENPSALEGMLDYEEAEEL